MTVTAELINNGGGGNNACLLISIGRALSENYISDEKKAKEAGWQAVIQSIEDDNSLGSLQCKYTAVRSGYLHDKIRMSEASEKKVKEALNRLPEEVPAKIASIKEKLTKFLTAIDNQNIPHSCAIVNCLSHDKIQNSNLHLLPKSKLEANPAKALTDIFDESKNNEKPINVICHSDGHFSNVVIRNHQDTSNVQDSLNVIRKLSQGCGSKIFTPDDKKKFKKEESFDTQATKNMSNEELSRLANELNTLSSLDKKTNSNYLKNQEKLDYEFASRLQIEEYKKAGYNDPKEGLEEAKKLFLSYENTKKDKTVTSQPIMSKL
ncbi:hypothetical protein L3V79_03930 [Thiotrichales bacterium 19S9-12]|nr:hypothetical protein [Thiotrichales bacterium 19S9-11]MCF6811506.1 hypothetical protein [Thiotrichales bacterium 19S9-12]